MNKAKCTTCGALSNLWDCRLIRDRHGCLVERYVCVYCHSVLEDPKLTASPRIIRYSEEFPEPWIMWTFIAVAAAVSVAFTAGVWYILALR